MACHFRQSHLSSTFHVFFEIFLPISDRIKKRGAPIGDRSPEGFFHVFSPGIDRRSMPGENRCFSDFDTFSSSDISPDSFGVRGKPVLFLKEKGPGRGKNSPFFFQKKGPSLAVENRLRFSTAGAGSPPIPKESEETTEKRSKIFFPRKKKSWICLCPFGALDKSVIAQKIACDFLSDLRFFFSRNRRKPVFFTEPYMLLSPPKIACDFRGGPARQKNLSHIWLGKKILAINGSAKKALRRHAPANLTFVPPKLHAILGGQK